MTTVCVWRRGVGGRAVLHIEINIYMRAIYKLKGHSGQQGPKGCPLMPIPSDSDCDR